MPDSPNFMPGDLLCFSGDSRISRAIEFFTCSRYSHVAICTEYKKEIVMFESTTMATSPCLISGRVIRGVQCHRPLERIQEYPGRVWRMRLNPVWSLRKDECRNLTSFLVDMNGRQYDEMGAILSDIRQFINVTDANYQRTFCSFLAAAALMRIQRLPIENGARFTPSGLLRKLRRVGVYLPPERLK